MTNPESTVRNLLKMAEMGTPEEAASAAARAAKIIDDHNLDTAQLTTDFVARKADPIVNEVIWKGRSTTLPLHVNYLVSAIVYLFGGECVISRSRRIYGIPPTVRMINRRSKIEICSVTMERWLTALETQTQKRIATDHIRGRREISSYRVGFAGNIAARCQQIMIDRKMDAEASMGALVRLDDDDIARKKLHDYKKLRKHRTGTASDRFAACQGAEDGESVAAGGQSELGGQLALGAG